MEKVKEIIKNKGFVLNEVIGKGSFGVVYRITHVNSGQSFAAKVLNINALSMKPNFNIERLLREVYVLSMLSHVNIVKLYMTIRTEDCIILIMELVLGIELFDRIIATSGLPENVSKDVFLQLCLALRYIHSKGIVHRDIKPENILFTGTASPEIAQNTMEDKDAYMKSLNETNPNGLHTGARIKLIDFGLSKTLQESINPDSFVGTPKYLAPEVMMLGNMLQQQQKNEQNKDINFPSIGTPADCYSAGVVLHVMLGACFPQFEDVQNAPHVIFKDPRIAKISPDAKDLISKLMTYDPSQRLTMNGALAHPWLKESLERYLASEDSHKYTSPPFPLKTPIPHSYEAFAKQISQDGMYDPSAHSTNLVVSNTNKNTALVSGMANSRMNPNMYTNPQFLQQPNLPPSPMQFLPLNTVIPQGPLVLKQYSHLAQIADGPDDNQRRDGGGVKRTVSKMMSIGEGTAQVSASTKMPAFQAHTQVAPPRKLNQNADVQLSQSDSDTSVESIQLGTGFVSNFSGSDTSIVGQDDEAVVATGNNQEYLIEPETLFQLQIQIERFFEEAYMIHRDNFEIAPKIRHSAVISRDLMMASLALISKLKHTAESIMAMFPDMLLALEENEIGMLTSSFTTIKSWIAALKQESHILLERNLDLTARVHECIELTKHSSRLSEIEHVRAKMSADDTMMMAQNSMSRLAIVDAVDNNAAMQEDKNENDDNHQQGNHISSLYSQRAQPPPSSSSSSSSGSLRRPPMTGETKAELGNFVEKLNHTLQSGKKLNEADVLGFAGPLIGKLAASKFVTPADRLTQIQKIDQERQHELTKALQILQKIDMLLKNHTHFWTQMEIAVDVLLQRGTHVESMTNFIRNPKLKTRFQERLNEYGMMWNQVYTVIRTFERDKRNVRPMYAFLNNS